MGVLKGIFSGLLNYGIENIMDIGTLILVVGAGVVVGLGEITGIVEDGATMDILSKIVVGEDEMKKRKLSALHLLSKFEKQNIK